MNHNARVLRWVAVLVVALAAILAPVASLPAQADSGLRINAGAESPDSGVQAAFYFQGDVIVRQGTTVRWVFSTREPHSVNFANGTGGGGPIDSGLNVKGAPDFKVKFPVPGDFSFHCDIHSAMVGIVHVLPPGGGKVPDQEYYDQLSARQKTQLLAEGYRLLNQNQNPGPRQVTAGIGIMHPTGEVYLLRYLKGVTTVKVGDTVTFTNRDPDAPHTITVNLDYPDPFAAQTQRGLTTDPLTLPGQATLSHPNRDKVNSGWLWAVPALPPPLARGTVFKMTFTRPGLYNYKCELHDTLGMTGQIQVLP